MIDIHCHILPGVDDGASSMDQALEMTAAADAAGTSDLILTPHCNCPGFPGNFPEPQLLQQFRAIRRAVRSAGLPVRIHAGAELFCDSDVLDTVQEKKVLTLAGSRYLLMEFPFDLDGAAISAAFEAFSKLGVVPVAAHPERYDSVQQSPDLLSGWFRQGFGIQLNKDSILGRLGRHARETALWALDHGFVHVVASDAHGTRARTADLQEVFQWIAGHYSPEYASLLLEENPRHILQDTLFRPA